jgi:hypothetical protein
MNEVIQVVVLCTSLLRYVRAIPSPIKIGIDTLCCIFQGKRLLAPFMFYN